MKTFMFCLLTIACLANAAIAARIDLTVDPAVIEYGCCAEVKGTVYKNDGSVYPNVPYALGGDVSASGTTDSRGNFRHNITASNVWPLSIEITAGSVEGATARATLKVARGQWEQTVNVTGSGSQNYRANNKWSYLDFSGTGVERTVLEDHYSRSFSLTEPNFSFGQRIFMLSGGPGNKGNGNGTASTTTTYEFRWVPVSGSINVPSKSLLTKQGSAEASASGFIIWSDNSPHLLGSAQAIAAVYTSIGGGNAAVISLPKKTGETSGGANPDPVSKSEQSLVSGSNIRVECTTWGAVGTSVCGPHGNAGNDASVGASVRGQSTAGISPFTYCK